LTKKALRQLSDIKCFLLDMDGTIYLGERLLPGAAAALAQMAACGRRRYFLTNNSSRAPEYYQQKLAKMGITASAEEILISTHSLLDYLAGKPGRRVFILGTPELKKLFAGAGYTVLTAGGAAADYVVVGFDTGLNYQDLSAACQYVDSGVPYVATHPDTRCPLDGGRYIPDCGSILALIRTATGVECSFTAGKPSRAMIEVALRRTGFKPRELAVVGDRLYTDIALGCDNGLFSILVLSGEARREDLAGSRVRPDLILDGIGDLAGLL
jgi:HAD superfamily hydrolase (TIGR01450 family)